MTPADLARTLHELQAAGLSSDELTRLHQSSIRGGSVTFGSVMSYLEGRRYLLKNIAFAERCRYVADKLRSGHTNTAELIREALLRTPLEAPLDSSPVATATPQPRRMASPQQPQAKNLRALSKQLGEEGEELALGLLRKRGYVATKLRTNSPIYDIKVQAATSSFYVSVKVSRSRQHVRLGSRKSVDGLTPGNFVFAFLPFGREEIDLSNGRYRLLILSAAEVRADALPVYDQYWAEKETPGYSVIIKEYNSQHREIWNRWLEYADAWAQLPAAE